MKASGPSFTISVFAGPTGGHLFPAVAFAQKWRERHPSSNIHLLTSRRAEKFVARLPPETFDEVLYFQDFPFVGRNPLRVFGFLIKLFLAFVSSSQYLSKNQPQLCVGFGSFVSYPGMLLASCRKIPTVIHEQNVVPGKANEWLLKAVDRVTVTFDQTWREKALPHREVLGLPIREELTSEGKQVGVLGGREDAGKPFHVLVMGGSQGARKLNSVFLQALEQLSREEKAKLAVNHITGMAEYDSILEQYKKVDVHHEVLPFSNEIQNCYRKADMAMTRAGANTLFELALFKLPALVIPYPHSGAHQSANAAYFESKQCVFSCPESVLKAEWIVEKIRYWMNHPEALKEYRQRMSTLTNSDSASDLVKLAESLLEKETLCELSTVT